MVAGELNINPLLEKLGKLVTTASDTMKELMQQEAALFVWNAGTTPGIINITAPFSKRDKRGQSAFLAGKAKIDRDIAAVFQPVKIKGTRTITQAFGKKLARPVKVKTKETWPDVAGIYSYRKQRKFERNQKIMSRGQRGAYYVDRSKLEVVRQESYRLIGLACSCWYLAAMQCDPPLKLRGVPSWITRHKSPFAAGDIQINDHSIRIELASTLPYNTALEMTEKVARVLGYRNNALERRLPYALRAAAKKSGMAA